MSELIRRARLALAEEQELFRRHRAENAARVRRLLPDAQPLADDIRRIFMNAMESSLISRDELAFINACKRSIELQEKLAALLSENGFEPDALYDRPMCRECADTGYAGTAVCACLKKHLSDVRNTELSALKTGSRTFESFDLNIFSTRVEPMWGISQRENMEGNLAFCRNWARTFSPSSPNLFLNGGTGQGKTFLCACMAKRVADSGVDVSYATAVSMFNDLEDRHFARGTPDVSHYYDCGLLIVDDLGTEMTTAFVQSALYDVINTRLTSGAKTIVNANLTADELRGRYMPQVCSRLLGEFKQLHFFGPDLRLR